METKEATLERYWTALNKLSAQLESDYYILAAVVYGSLARGEPWEKSDIDMMIVLRDDPQNRAPEHVWMSADGINVAAELYPRNTFKRALEGTLQGSVLHSVRSQFKLLFTKDDSIAAWLNESAQIGERDWPFQLLRTTAEVLYPLEKAAKWLVAKRDLHYSFLWILHTVNALARVEVVLNGEAPGREALDQALKLNPAFFKAVYLDLIDGPKTEPVIAGALKQLDDYLVERADVLFAPVLEYLAEGDSPRTITELGTHFAKKTQACDLSSAYNWLSDHGIIQKLASPLHLTRKSQVMVEEQAYYYDRGPGDWQ
jgi:hypothetical protein